MKAPQVRWDRTPNHPEFYDSVVRCDISRVCCRTWQASQFSAEQSSSRQSNSQGATSAGTSTAKFEVIVLKNTTSC